MTEGATPLLMFWEPRVVIPVPSTTLVTDVILGYFALRHGGGVLGFKLIP